MSYERSRLSMLPRDFELSDRAREIAGSVFYGGNSLCLLNTVRTISPQDRAAIDELLRAGLIVRQRHVDDDPGTERWRGKPGCNDHREFALERRGGLELVTIERDRAKRKGPADEGGAESE